MIKQRGTSFEATVNHDGNRYRRSFKSQQEAAVWEAQTRLDLLNGKRPDMGALARLPADTPRTLGELQNYVYRRYWAGTKSERMADINSRIVVSTIGEDIDIRTINETHIDTLVFELERLGNGNATINRKLATLSKMMTVASERGWISRKPKLDRKREPANRIRFLSPDEENRLLTFVRHIGRGQAAEAFAVLLDTGLRVGEALASKWEDIDLDRGTITVWRSKADKPRTVPLTARAKKILKDIRDRTVGGSGPFSNIEYGYLRHAWIMARAHMGLHGDEQFVIHSLRHTFASRLVQVGVPILTVKELCGHKTIEVTLKYAHLAPHNLIDAIAKLNSMVT
jgi:integrase